MWLIPLSWNELGLSRRNVNDFEHMYSPLSQPHIPHVELSLHHDLTYLIVWTFHHDV